MHLNEKLKCKCHPFYCHNSVNGRRNYFAVCHLEKKNDCFKRVSLSNKKSQKPFVQKKKKTSLKLGKYFTSLKLHK